MVKMFVVFDSIIIVLVVTIVCSESDGTIRALPSNGHGGSNSTTIDIDQLHQLAGEFHMQLMREHFLSALQLTAPPNVSGVELSVQSEEVPILDYGVTWGPRQTYQDLENGMRKKKVMIMASNAFNSTKACGDPANRTGLYIKLPRGNYEILNTELWYFSDGNLTGLLNSTDGGRIDVSATKCAAGVLENTTYNVSHRVQKENPGWLTFDVWSHLSALTAVNGDTVVFNLMLNDQPWNHSSIYNITVRPYLVLDTLEVARTHGGKTKRSARDCPPGLARNHSSNDDGHSTCCRTSFYVNITTLGWSNWIVHPPGFHYYYCAGDCKAGFDAYEQEDEKLPSHSALLNLFSDTIGVRPCCVAKKWAHLPVSILSEDARGLFVNKTFAPNMIIEQCACSGTIH